MFNYSSDFVFVRTSHLHSGYAMKVGYYIMSCIYTRHTLLFMIIVPAFYIGAQLPPVEVWFVYCN